ncbi:SirB2 family protein [Pontibacterium sp.]|jgi:uncharacterized membrane protein SirB2|uniref:SirB2 family protein n=1 Tax=Pontibacterium sp. TaxID=2036026 RepID=UPI003567E700
MSYLAIKHIHVTAVILSLTFFLFRGWCMMQKPRLLSKRWMRIGPDIVDTVLLVSAGTLAFKLQQYPFVDSWLTAKVLGLLAYIVLGSIALRRGRTRAIRIAALTGAICTAGYIVAVALTHHPEPWLIL